MDAGGVDYLRFRGGAGGADAVTGRRPAVIFADRRGGRDGDLRYRSDRFIQKRYVL